MKKKLLITEKVLRNLIRTTLKEVLDEAPVNLAQAFPGNQDPKRSYRQNPLRYNRGDIAKFEKTPVKDRQKGVPERPQTGPYERGERQIAQQLNRCLKAIPDERAAIMAYKAEPDMWNKAVNTPQTFIMKMKNDENAKNYFNGMLLSREELGPTQESWLFQTLKALGKKCPGQ
jgi:hypothetical protein